MRASAAALAAFALVAAGMAADTLLRARAACREGERWLEQAEHPERRRAELDSELRLTLEGLDRARAEGRLDEATYARESGLARFRRDREAERSAYKIAYVWLDSAARLFTPPDNRWSRRARAELPRAREGWRRDRLSRGLPVEDFRLR